MTPKLALAGGALAFLLALVALLPILLLAGTAASTCASGNLPASLAAIAATIRHLESGDDYSARAPGSNASGAYQFLDSSWAGYGGFPSAYLAPAVVQDARAADLITSVLEANNGEVSAVPVSWYIGHVPADGSAEWDRVPAQSAGNRLTPREYQLEWMSEYERQLRGPPQTSSNSFPGRHEVESACGSSSTVVGDFALPLDRIWFVGHPDWLTKPHHDYPAADLPVPPGTPVYSASGGTVVAVTSSGRCGVGVVVNAGNDVQFTYCHGLPGSPTVTVGDVVIAGRELMLSASTGNSTAPHLHFGIRIDGHEVCPQPLLQNLMSGSAIDPSTLPARDCTN